MQMRMCTIPVSEQKHLQRKHQAESRAFRSPNWVSRAVSAAEYFLAGTGPIRLDSKFVFFLDLRGEKDELMDLRAR